MTVESIALVGFMGAGKSRVGEALAQRLGVPFVDTDAVIVEQVGAIERVFAEQGEPAFRALECAAVAAVLKQARRADTVVSLGGGAVTALEVREALAAIPHVVWLTAAPAVLFARATQGGRPLAADETVFRRLLEERRRWYSAVATVGVDNDGTRTVDEVVEEVLRKCAIKKESA